ncbi:MAG: methyltransferase domain-containing protein [Anaerolineae bacterium]
MSKRVHRQDLGAPQNWLDYELELIPGLEGIVQDELSERFGSGVVIVAQPQPGRIQIKFRGSPGALTGLRSVVAVHLRQRFAIPRPRALLGHEHMTHLVSMIRNLVLQQRSADFATLKLSAAGSQSPVFTRFQEQLASSLGLSRADRQGDLLVTVRRPLDRSPGWEVLVRTTPRPLSARAWRVRDMPGALNATVAHAMVRLTGRQPGKVVLNLACGSGTLLVEYLEQAPSRLAIGVDSSAAALKAARENLTASGHASEVVLINSDAANLPLASRAVDVLLADLPYGMLVGSTAENVRLYPALLLEAARVAVPSAGLVAITASKRLFELAIVQLEGKWLCQGSLPIKVPFKGGYLSPTIYLLRRLPSTDTLRGDISTNIGNCQWA